MAYGYFICIVCLQSGRRPPLQQNLKVFRLIFPVSLLAGRKIFRIVFAARYKRKGYYSRGAKNRQLEKL
jgi:hypothetical protein